MRKTKTAAPSWSTCSLGPCNSPARPKRKPAAGATSAPRTAAASTKARPRSRRSKGCAGCRNAGIPVPKEIIDKAVQYIKDCTLPEGGVQYSSKGGGGRPAITAAAIACLFNAGRIRRRLRAPDDQILRAEPRAPTTAAATAIGTTPIFTIPRSNTAKAANAGNSTATKCEPSCFAKPPK